MASDQSHHRDSPASPASFDQFHPHLHAASHQGLGAFKKVATTAMSSICCDICLRVQVSILTNADLLSQRPLKIRYLQDPGSPRGYFGPLLCLTGMAPGCWLASFSMVTGPRLEVLSLGPGSLLRVCPRSISGVSNSIVTLRKDKFSF